MPGVSVFDWTCGELERASALSQLEARGTVRIALKSAGLDAISVAPEEMQVVILRVLPAELAARAIEDSEAVCDAIAKRLAEQHFDSEPGERPDLVFERLGGGR